MSHINEALKKAQRDRDVHSLRYSGILAASGRKRRIFSGRTILWAIPLIIVIFLAFFYDSWLDFTSSQTPEPSEKDQERFQSTPKGTGPAKPQENVSAKPREIGLRKRQETIRAKFGKIGVEENQETIPSRPEQSGLKKRQGTDSGRPGKIGQRKLFVGAVRVVVVQSPAEQQGIDSQSFFEGRDDRDRAAFANKHRRAAKSAFDGLGSSRHVRTVQRNDHSRSVVHVDQL